MADTTKTRTITEAEYADLVRRASHTPESCFALVVPWDDAREDAVAVNPANVMKVGKVYRGGKDHAEIDFIDGSTMTCGDTQAQVVASLGAAIRGQRPGG